MDIDGYTVEAGDCRAYLSTLPDSSIDAIVTDPPYGLSREPDALEVLRHWLAGDDYEHTGSGFMGKTWDSFVPGPSIWREVLRVLKPGGHACVFAGSRTVDLMGLSLRIAGFEIRDQLQWLYGTGFPKSLDVSKAIDKASGAEREVIGVDEHRARQQTPKRSTQALGDFAGSGGKITAPATDDAKRWSGWGTALKPAHEPIVLARKPLIGTVAANVLEHGTGGINVDGCRIGLSKQVPASPHEAQDRIFGAYGSQTGSESGHDPNIGRWPANVILDPVAGEALDAQSGILRSGKLEPYHQLQASENGSMSGPNQARTPSRTFGGDTGGASRFFYCAKASKAEREAGLDAFRKATAGELTGGRAEGSAGLDNPRAGAGRKSSGRANIHPTVKPIALMRWLVRLVTPPGGLVLDPFTGSGSTGCAAVLEGFRFLGIELSNEYSEIARARIAHHAGSCTLS